MSDTRRDPGEFAVRRRLVAVERPQLVVGLTPDLCPHLAPSIDRLPAFANTLEAWGVDQIAVGDRIVTGAGIVHPNGGEPLPPPAKPLLEPLTLLAAAASCTSTIRLGTSVLLAALRNPVVLAKTVATLDVLSCGRFDLGLGSGWFEGEFDAVGVSLDERWARLEETIHVCRVLWRDARPRRIKADGRRSMACTRDPGHTVSRASRFGSVVGRVARKRDASRASAMVGSSTPQQPRAT